MSSSLLLPSARVALVALAVGPAMACGKSAPTEPERASYAWVERFGASGAASEPTSIALDGSGAVLMTGGLLGSIEVGSTHLTGGSAGTSFVLELDAHGAPSWTVPWAAPTSSAVYAVGTDPAHDVFVTGRAGAPAAPDAPTDGFFVAKLDPSGKKLWQTPLTIMGGFAPLHLAVSGGGFSLVSARTTDALTLAMVDPTGEQCWGLAFPLSCGSAMAGIATNASSTSAITGAFDCPLDLGGGPLPVSGEESAFVAAFDASGDLLWSRGFGVSGGTVAGRAVAVDDAGDVFVTGDYSGSPDFGGGALPASAGGLFAVALDPKGKHLWSRGYDGASAVAGRGVAVASSGAAFVMATATAPVDLGGLAPEPPGTYVFELRAKGVYGGVNRFVPEGAGSSFTGAGVAVGANGQVAFAGSLTGTVAFGSTTVTSAGTSDLVAGLLAP